MITAMMQMFTAEPVKEETVFDIEFDEVEIPEGGQCQVQFYITPLDGYDSVGVDWGDGTVQDWPESQYTMWHNWTEPGRYRVKFDRRLQWFRFTECWTSANGRTYASRPLVRPVQWGDFVESAQGTYGYWTGLREGRGLQGGVIRWGRSIRTAHCCYQGSTGLVGSFPKWGPSFVDCTGVYDGCSGLAGPIPPWPRDMVKCDQCYQNTGATGTIPAWPSGLTSARMCYRGCTGLDGAWTDDPELLMPEQVTVITGMVTGHDDVVTGAGEGLRALFYEDWGGTKVRPE